MKSSSHFGYIIWISSVAALGGLLFGYDTAVVSGAVEYLQKHFELSDLQLGWVVSSALFGCIAGAGIAGWMGDKFGRKRAMMICGLLFLVSTVGSALAETADQLVWTQIIGGVGVGAASLLTPVYISEIAPPSRRGALTTLNQMAILLGMVITYIVNAQLANAYDEAWRIQTSWRWMFASEAVPTLLFMGLLFFIPESPRWLVSKKREEEAAVILRKLGSERLVAEEIADIHNSFVGEKVPWGKIFAPPYRKILVFGAILAAFQQLVGINIVMYYAPRIFTSAGVATSTAIGHSVIIGVAMLVFTVVALVLADRIGRRPLLLASCAGMALSLAALAVAFGRIVPGQEGQILVWVLLYVAAFSIGMGPLVWTVITEIFPNRIRGRAAGICVFGLWIANFLVSQFFPYMLTQFGYKTFWVHAAFSAFSFVFILLAIPETKGRTLEEVEQLFSPS